MESIKAEETPLLQAASAAGLAQLLRLCEPRSPCPNPKVVRNLIR